MTYAKLKETFCKFKREHLREDLTAHIVFTSDSFSKEYSRMSRTYVFTSGNKAFQPNMGGYSIFGDCLDGTDMGVRLEQYMAEERGGKSGWKVETCYILEKMRDAEAVASYERVEQGDATVCFYFGNTCIRAIEKEMDGRVLFLPVGGDQTACGEWVELDLDVVAGYCTLLARRIHDK